MFNGVGFNSVMLNAARSAAFVLASASFQAEATVTPADAIISQAGIADWVNDSVGVFGGRRDRFARSTLSAEAIPVFVPNVNWTAKSYSWEASGGFFCFVVSEVTGEPFTWHAGASISLIPQAQLAVTNFLGEATLSLEQELSQAAQASWQSYSSNLDIPEGDRESLVWSKFIGENTLNAEASVTTVSDGVLRQDGFTDFVGTLNWEVDNTLNPIFLDNWIVEIVGEFAGASRLTQAIALDTQQGSGLGLTGFRTTKANVDFNIGLSFVLNGSKEQYIASGLETTSSYFAPAKQEHASGVAYPIVDSLVFAPAIQRHAGSTLWAAGIVVDSFEATREHGGNFSAATFSANQFIPSFKTSTTFGWEVDGFSISIAGKQSLVPAPDHRQFILSGEIRTFKLSGGTSRNMRLSA